MIFNRREVIQNLDITLNGTTISQTTDVKYLDLTVIGDLKWKTHIQHPSKKLARTVGIMELGWYVPWR